MRSLARGRLGGFLGGVSQREVIYGDLLRKLCERSLLLMVWVQKKSTARWLEKVVTKELLCGLWLEGVREAFWEGFYKGRSYTETYFDKTL